MQNPWEQLAPNPGPYVLASDQSTVNQFHQRLRKPRKDGSQDQARWESQRIHDELFPEPFIGRPDAPLVLLNLNPGYSPQDLTWHGTPAFEKIARANLRHESLRYPFYPLDPSIAGSPVSDWWKKALKPWLACFSNPNQGADCLAQLVLALEYFPYHSKSFGTKGTQCQIPSQDDTWNLVRQALDRHKPWSSYYAGTRCGRRRSRNSRRVDQFTTPLASKKSP